METNGTKKIQWAIFSPDRSESIVIRTDDKEEAMQLRGWAKGVLPAKNGFPEDEGNSAHTKEEVQEEAKDWCPIHKVNMRLWTKNGRSWYSHGYKDEEGNTKWCSGETYEK